MQLNLLLSTTSDFLMCFPHNAFYIHNALFVDAVNKDSRLTKFHCTLHQIQYTLHKDVYVLYELLQQQNS